MPSPRLSCEQLTLLVSRAQEGDHGAWSDLVHGLSAAVYSSLRSFDISVEERNDLFQETFVKLVESLDKIDAPCSLPKWMMTTSRHLALGRVQRLNRVVPSANFPDQPDPTVDASEALLDGELKAALLAAFAKLSEPCQQLLRYLSADPPMSYAEIAETLGRSAGFIGPTRARCLDSLRKMPELNAFIETPS